MARRTKIVATLGPACDTAEGVDALIAAGIDVARINLSHGTVEESLARVDRVRKASARADRHVGVLADLPGPKVRSGVFPDGGVYLMEGSTVRLEPGEGPSTGSV